MVKLKGGRHSQAKKAHRKSIKRKLYNLRYKKKLKEAAKNLKKLIDEKKKEEAIELYKKIESLIDKMKVKGILHKNTASRKKSKLSRDLNLLIK